jgi:nitronate monooxygenase
MPDSFDHPTVEVEVTVMPSSLFADWRLPLIAAPMTGVSGLDLVVAACRGGIGGSFPAHNAGGVDGFGEWLDLAIRQTLAHHPDGRVPGPVIPNLIVHRSNVHRARQIDAIVSRDIGIVITSVGSPEPVIPALHEGGCAVLADVASVHHARRAVAAGADGLILLCAGGGGQTGWANPLSFIRAVRGFWDGPTVIAGGVADGWGLWAALAAGYDAAYMGTRFIATSESSADDGYKAALTDASLDDVYVTSAQTGLTTSVLGSQGSSQRESARSAARSTFDAAIFDRVSERPSRGEGGGYSAGHSVSGVTEVLPVADLLLQVEEQFRTAVRHSQELAPRYR